MNNDSTASTEEKAKQYFLSIANSKLAQTASRAASIFEYIDTKLKSLEDDKELNFDEYLRVFNFLKYKIINLDNACTYLEIFLDNEDIRNKYYFEKSVW